MAHSRRDAEVTYPYHIPGGLGDACNPTAAERTPHRPKEGDYVTVRAITSRAVRDRGQRVWLVWSLNQTLQEPTPAQLCPDIVTPATFPYADPSADTSTEAVGAAADASGFAVWQASFGPFQAADTVEYSFVVVPEGDKPASDRTSDQTSGETNKQRLPGNPVYSFRVLRRNWITRVTCVVQNGNSFYLLCRAAHGEAQPSVVLSFHSDSTVKMTVLPNGVPGYELGARPVLTHWRSSFRPGAGRPSLRHELQPQACDPRYTLEESDEHLFIHGPAVTCVVAKFPFRLWLMRQRSPGRKAGWSSGWSTWTTALDRGVEQADGQRLEEAGGRAADQAVGQATNHAADHAIEWWEAPTADPGDEPVDSITINLRAYENESIYGLGERFDHLNQRGRIVDTYVCNQYLDQGSRTYLPIPFFISTSGYGFLVEDSNHTRFDFGSTKAERHSITVDMHMKREHRLDTVLFTGDIKEVLKEYADYLGRPPVPPKWAFGPWMSSNGWDCDREVRAQVERTIAEAVPATVIVIEAWSDEATFYIWYDAVYTERADGRPFTLADFHFPRHGRWPDPKGLIDFVHAAGLRVLLWQIPVLKKSPEVAEHRQRLLDEEFMIAHGYCIRNGDGTPYHIPTIPPRWFEGSLLMDFTNPEAVEWWFAKRRYLVEELNADGFKTDGGEFLWGDDVRLHDGSSGTELHNSYSLLYIRAYRHFLQALRGNDALTFSRSGFTGAHLYPAHWAGDELSTFAAFRHSLVAGLTAGLSGIAFWGWDLAGFSGEIPSADLYCRAAAMATFCPIMQYHAERKSNPSIDRTPWNIAERTGRREVLSIYRRFANLRMNLLPYIFSQACASVASGLPLMRAMAIDYPEDHLARDAEDQYLFGDAFLVAPVLEENARGRYVYLPAGDWINFWTGERRVGPARIWEEHDWSSLPVFVRAGSVIPMNLGRGREYGSPVGNRVDDYSGLTFVIAPAGSPTSSPPADSLQAKWWYSDEQRPVLIAGRRHRGRVEITLDSLPHQVDAYTVAAYIPKPSAVRCGSLPLQPVEASEVAEVSEATTNGYPPGVCCQGIWWYDHRRRMAFARLPASTVGSVVEFDHIDCEEGGDR